MELIDFTFKPIGFYRSSSKSTYDTPRQPQTDDPRLSFIELLPQQQFEQALIGLPGFDYIWVISVFHHHLDHWKPMILPPRSTQGKQGVFATRAPYRPNPLGLSCFKIHHIEKLKIFIQGGDLLDGTPVLDIKPYIQEHDAKQSSKQGWLAHIEQHQWHVQFSQLANEQILFLESSGLTELRFFIQQQLEFHPTDSDRKRTQPLSDQTHMLCYKTWRVIYELHTEIQTLKILSINIDQNALQDALSEKTKGEHELMIAFYQKFLK